MSRVISPDFVACRKTRWSRIRIAFRQWQDNAPLMGCQAERQVVITWLQCDLSIGLDKGGKQLWKGLAYGGLLSLEDFNQPLYGQ